MADILEKIQDRIEHRSDRLQKHADRIIEGIDERVDGYLEGTYDPKVSAKKKAVKGATVLVLMASLLTGIAFSGPAEITADQAGTKVNQPPIVMDIGDYGNATLDDDDDDATEQKSGKAGLVARFKQAVLNMPKAVRVLIIVPLWAIGTGIMTLISVFWKFLFATPVGGVILSTFVGWGVLIGLFALTAKILFPEIPLSRILTKKNVIILAFVALGLGIADAVAPLFWSKYPFAAGALKLGVGASVVAILTARVKAVFHRDKYKNMPQTA